MGNVLVWEEQTREGEVVEEVSQGGGFGRHGQDQKADWPFI